MGVFDPGINNVKLLKKKRKTIYDYKTKDDIYFIRIFLV